MKHLYNLKITYQDNTIEEEIYTKFDFHIYCYNLIQDNENISNIKVYDIEKEKYILELYPQRQIISNYL